MVEKHEFKTVSRFFFFCSKSLFLLNEIKYEGDSEC